MRNRTRLSTKKNTSLFARNARESNGEQCSELALEGRKWWKIIPVGTISREVMRPKKRGRLLLQHFCTKGNRLSMNRLQPVATNWLVEPIQRDGFRKERETRLELATASLEGTLLYKVYSNAFNWLYKRL